MSVFRNAAGSTVVPTLRYRDLPGAIAWLSAAFGFKPHHVTRDSDGQAVAAQLVLGRGMVMLAPVGGSVFDDLLKQPDEIGGAETQTSYFVISDADAHFATAQEHGAETVLELQNFEHGGRGYLCRDPEGHLWSFGTFSPWDAAADSPSFLTAARQLPPRTIAVAAGAAASVVVAVAAWGFVGSSGVSPEGPRPSAIALFKERGARLAAERAIVDVRREKDTADLEADKLQEQLAHLTGAKIAAEGATASAEGAMRRLTAQLEKSKADHAEANKAVRRLVARNIQERRVRERSRRRATEQLNEALTLERQVKQRFERTTLDLKLLLEKESAAKVDALRAHEETKGQLAKEREARTRSDASLVQATQQLKAEQDARRAAEQLSPAAPTPRPARRPDRGAQ